MKEEIRNRIKNKTVGIAGCGGLGSNCAVSLARIGIGKLIIADFDIVSKDNLNRQYFFYDQIGILKVRALKENIQRIDKNVIVETHEIKLDQVNIIKVFSNCDVIVEAFDIAEMKQMIIETILAHFPEKYIVAASGIAGWGNNNSITTRQIGKLFLCGDGLTEVSDGMPPLAPRVGIVANLEANQVLEILLNTSEQL
jgi:sulfur carrier protein ThiS adenylyltransferase